mmetsp:Transcript_38114/g.51577  ORF Transcript_38114/g.51577 Transcript_38114/m.51577 type:complete len:176 (-) Transcript_38114:321-848(-)
MQQVLSWGLTISAWMGNKDACADNRVAPLEFTPSEDYDGQLITQTSKGTVIFNFKAAEFGPRMTNMTSILMPAKPSLGCKLEEHQVRIKGMIVVLDRGGCGFSDKVLVSQQAGAIAVLIINHDEAVIPMNAPEDAAQQAKIPLIMVNDAFNEVKLVAFKNNEFIIARTEIPLSPG